MLRFILDPTYGTAVQTSDRALVVRFGDGYEQRSPDGLNARRLTYDVKFNAVRTTKASAVLDFLRSVGTTTAFIWTPPAPNDTPRTFVIREGWQHVHQGFDNHNIAVRFDEDFNPAAKCVESVIAEAAGTITITSATAGASIRYTYEGADPTETTGTVYVAPFAAPGEGTYRAIAFKTDRLPSAVTEQEINF